MKRMYQKYFSRILVVLSLLTFTSTFVSYNIHQLEHINDVVCTSSDNHIHSADHEDICKNLGYFNFYEFKSFQLNVVLDFCTFEFISAEDTPVIGNLYDTSVRGPPSCSIVI